MEINVGEFVRTDINVIAKVIDICKDGSYELDIEFETDYIVYDFNITKHSKDIIDLIEVGDYVNGHKVDEVSVEQKALWLENRKYFNESINDKDIKSILTHEQFESNAYTIEKER